MSYAPEFKCQGEWCGNAMRFATEKEADTWGRDLMMRWFIPTDSRVVPSDDPVNYEVRSGLDGLYFKHVEENASG